MYPVLGLRFLLAFITAAPISAMGRYTASFPGESFREGLEDATDLESTKSSNEGGDVGGRRVFSTEREKMEGRRGKKVLSIRKAEESRNCFSNVGVNHPVLRYP